MREPNRLYDTHFNYDCVCPLVFILVDFLGLANPWARSRYGLLLEGVRVFGFWVDFVIA